jgi:lipopolysaccharide transport system permease protein
LSSTTELVPPRSHSTTSRSHKIVLEPRPGWQPIHFGELWDYRELLIILAARDIKVRYKQTVLGAAWAVIQPLLYTVAFVAFFSGQAPANVDSRLFFYTGSLIWQLFASAVSSAGNSLIGNQNLISKIYFPRLVIPIAAVIVSLADFVVGFALLIVMLLIFPAHWSLTMLLFPVFVAMAFLAAVAVGLWFSAMNVEFRDIRYVIPFIIQFGLFVTPVIVPLSNVHKPWKRLLLELNPMSGPVEGFRWCILRTEFQPSLMIISCCTITAMLIGGLYYFRRMEKTFADLV